MQYLFPFYEKILFRKLKLDGYINRKRNEQKMINRFKKIFGDEKSTLVCFGDFEQKRHMKFKEPIKGKGMRTLFRKSGFETYLVDEFRTSCKCAKCEGGECVKFMVRENPTAVSWIRKTDSSAIRSQRSAVSASRSKQFCKRRMRAFPRFSLTSAPTSCRGGGSALMK